MIYFKPSQYQTEIVGEQSYQKDLREIAMYKDLVEKDDMEAKMTGIEAVLILEDDNKFDPGNAVRVSIEGKTVGYLAKENAALYRKAIAKLGLTDATCIAEATAFGKREAPGKVMQYGIWLSLDLRSGLEYTETKPRKKLFGLF